MLPLRIFDHAVVAVTWPGIFAWRLRRLKWSGAFGVEDKDAIHYATIGETGRRTLSIDQICPSVAPVCMGCPFCYSAERRKDVPISLLTAQVFL